MVKIETNMFIKLIATHSDGKQCTEHVRRFNIMFIVTYNKSDRSGGSNVIVKFTNTPQTGDFIAYTVKETPEEIDALILGASPQTAKALYGKPQV